MEKYKLTKEDYEQLEQIIKVTKSIENLYTKLFKLECSGNKDTKEYQQLLQMLLNELKKEKSIYNGTNPNSSEKYLALGNYILKAKVPTEYSSDIESLMTQRYENRIYRRILNMLLEYVNIEYKNPKTVISFEELSKEEINNIENIASKIISNAIHSSIVMCDSFEQDMYSTYLKLLEENISINAYANFQDRLISSKYHLAFYNKKIEDYLIANNFEVPETLYISSKLMAALNRIIDEEYKIVKDNYYESILTEQISQLIEIGDMDYNNKQIVITSLLRQCMIRTILSLVSNDIIEKQRKTIKEFITKESYKERHPYDKISIQLLLNCFDGIDKDKSKQSVVSLVRKQ